MYRKKIIILGIFALVQVILHFITFNVTKDVLNTVLMRSAQGVAVSTARIIESDIEGYKEFVRVRDITSPYYIRMNTLLSQIKDEGGMAYIYVSRLVGGQTFEFILDAEEINSEDWSAPGDEDSWDIGKAKVYEGLDDSTSYGFTEKSQEWGYLIVGYAPILDSDNKIVGVVGVDIDGENIYDFLNNSQRVLFIVYIGMLVIILVVLQKSLEKKLLGKVSYSLDTATAAFSQKDLGSIVKEGLRDVKLGKELYLFLIYVDDLDWIIESYGQDLGDLVLDEVSKKIFRALRQGDRLVRSDRAEFLGFVRSDSGVNIRRVAERVRKSVANLSIPVEEEDLQVSVSISIVQYNLKDKLTDLIEIADVALQESEVERNVTVQAY